VVGETRGVKEGVEERLDKGGFFGLEKEAEEGDGFVKG
jgi:hypothetical protein